MPCVSQKLYHDETKTSRRTLTFNPPRPYQRFMPTCSTHSLHPSSHSPHVSFSPAGRGGIHIAIPRTLSFSSESASLATKKRALRIPHRQRMPRECRLRVRLSFPQQCQFPPNQVFAVYVPDTSCFKHSYTAQL